MSSNFNIPQGRRIVSQGARQDVKTYVGNTFINSNNPLRQRLGSQLLRGDRFNRFNQGSVVDRDRGVGFTGPGFDVTYGNLGGIGSPVSSDRGVAKEGARMSNYLGAGSVAAGIIGSLFQAFNPPTQIWINAGGEGYNARPY